MKDSVKLLLDISESERCVKGVDLVILKPINLSTDESFHSLQRDGLVSLVVLLSLPTALCLTLTKLK